MSNFLLWSKAVAKFLSAKDRLDYIYEDPPNITHPTLKKWRKENDQIIIWLWKCIEQNIAASFMFHDIDKYLWQDLKITFAQEKNQSKIFDLYKKTFSNLHGDRSLTDYFSSVKSITDELNLYQPLTSNLEELKR